MSQPPVPAQPWRSFNMRRIKSRDTSIELALRRALWRMGVRYRKNDKRLPGSPDIAITRFRIAVFCDGEFWHGENWEARKPKLQNNRDYWIAKIERNMRRDLEIDRRLVCLGWTVIRFWGGEIRKNLPSCVEAVREAMFQAQLDAFDDAEPFDVT